MNPTRDNSGLTTDQLLQINRICNSFESAWEEGEPTIQRHLQQATDAAILPALLNHLVELDIEYRRHRGRMIDAASYCVQHPELDQDWLEHRLLNTLGTGSTEYHLGGEQVAREREESDVSLTAKELVDRIRSLQLVSEDELQTVVLNNMNISEVSADKVAQALIASQHLTPFQSQSIYRRPGDTLVLGDYVLLEQIGQGGMGTVYRAMHRRMKRIVALKVLRKDIAHSADLAKRFRREVEVAARLSHPNIVTAYDAREQQGLSYLVCEYIEGNNLSEVVKEHGPLSPRQHQYHRAAFFWSGVCS